LANRNNNKQRNTNTNLANINNGTSRHMSSNLSNNTMKINNDQEPHTANVATNNNPPTSSTRPTKPKQARIDMTRKKKNQGISIRNNTSGKYDNNT
jgi:hypothetical protein